MSCEFTPPPGQAQQPSACATGTAGVRKTYVYQGVGSDGNWLSAAEVEAMEHDELDAEGRHLLAWVLALLGCVAAFAFVLGYTTARMGLL